MTASRLEYPFVNGFVDHWLVAGPRTVLVPDLERLDGEGEWRLDLVRQLHSPNLEIQEPPVELGAFGLESARYTWRYVRCRADHLVDLSAIYPSCHYLVSWAYTEIMAPSAQEVTCILATHGPADVWVNGSHAHRQEHLTDGDPKRASFAVALREGLNEVLVRLEQVALRACPYAMGLQILGLPVSGSEEEAGAFWSERVLLAVAGDTEEEAPSEPRVLVPVKGADVLRRLMLERVFEQVFVEERVVYKGNKITLHWSPELQARVPYASQVQDARGRIYVEALPEAEPGKTEDVGHIARIFEGEYDVVLRASPQEYYERDTRYERRIPITVLDTQYSNELYGTLDDRRTEALEHAARRGEGIYSEVAKMTLGWWSEIAVDRIRQAVARVNRREDGSALQLLALLGAVSRFGEDPSFPRRVLSQIEECVLGFRYWHDEPGRDAMCFAREGHMILYHACEILAGQMYPSHTFSNTGYTGQWHREKGEQLALDWLHARGTEGFAEWDSSDSFALDVVALSHLMDLSENTTVQELAAVVMDKLLLTMALNSFKGVFGSTHGRTDTATLMSGQLEATSGISRLLWGMGVWNRHIAGTVSLAVSGYEMPLIIAEIAISQPGEFTNREQHPGVNKVTYRTPEYMLCSAQDYRPGGRGSDEHIWQATLGPDAVVFVNHPACATESDARRPNYWRGNRRLPRVAQWKDTLVALYDLGDDDPLGFTHAYFPTGAFDEHCLQNGWAYARKGQAYLAITAAQGISLVIEGHSAYRELRSHGRRNAWLCLLGRQVTDGNFERFQRKVRALRPELSELAVRCRTLRGDNLAFGWDGPLTVNGEEQPLSGFKHYDNPYCTAETPVSEMEVRTPSFMMRLRFGL